MQTYKNKDGFPMPVRANDAGKVMEFLGSRGMYHKFVAELLTEGWIYQSTDDYLVFVERELQGEKEVGYEELALGNQPIQHGFSPFNYGTFWLGDNRTPKNLYLFEGGFDLLICWSFEHAGEEIATMAQGNDLYINTLWIVNVDKALGLVLPLYPTIEKIVCCYPDSPMGRKSVNIVKKHPLVKRGMITVIPKHPQIKLMGNPIS